MLQEKNDSLSNEQQNLQQHITDLQTELVRERELRTRLEESQKGLTQHVRDMELAVEMAEEQVDWSVV